MQSQTIREDVTRVSFTAMYVEYSGATKEVKSLSFRRDAFNLPSWPVFQRSTSWEWSDNVIGIRAGQYEENLI